MNKATVQIFFEERGFHFEQDFEAIDIQVPDNEVLSKDLENTLYFYQFKNEQTKTSFYLTIRELNKEETFYIKRYIWNKANTEIYFLSDKKELQLLVTDQPQRTNKIATFKYNETDEEKLQKIHKTEFDRGTFWLNFANFLNKKKTSQVDKKLVETLKKLKEDLLQEYKALEIQKPKEIVQALIDRTLFIKFLEDNHIINSFFYEKKFQDKDLNYKSILTDKDKATINQLFEEINEIFSSHLFETPKIQDWSDNVFFLLKEAISKTEISGQLSLFDFDFSVMPIEFIANIYEVFFEENLEEGIFYTPHDLAQLIVDETLKNKIGKVLDPACGSGMFLVMAFRKIVENTQKDFNQLSIEEVITYKSELLEKYIFGIEKKEYARRLALFALYLEILKDINPKDLKAYINQKLRNQETISLFEKVGKLNENVICANSLETEATQKPHKDQNFDFMVGNPPFFEIKQDQKEERRFVEKFEIRENNETLKAKEIIGKYQISQCFMLKVKEWANPETRLGFVLNYSNFTNEKSADFQKFFFTHYQLEKFYEMSEIKQMLFENAMESVGVAIFKNQKINDNTINYLKVEKNSFSDTFKTILIQEENTIQISQEDILSQKRTLRDYLFANEYDFKLLEKIEKQSYKGFWEFIEWIRENKDDCSFFGLDAVKLVGYIELFSQVGILSEYNPKSINPEKILLTSDLIKYYLSIKFSKYQGYAFSTLNREESHKIPIPKNLDEDIVEEIIELSHKLSEGALKYEGNVKKEVNELVGDLYKLDFLETTRIGDFLEKPDRKLTEKEIYQIYCETLQDSLRLYTQPKIQVYVGKNLPFNLACVGIYYDTENYPATEKTLQSIINDLVKDTNNPYQVFYPIQRIYFAKKVIYIIKENKFKNWSETKAFEDAQEILKTSLKK